METTSAEWMTSLAMMMSFAAILVLAWFDPKSNKRHRGESRAQNFRKGMALIMLLPGLLLVILEMYAAFVVWFIAVGALGWLAAKGLAMIRYKN